MTETLTTQTEQYYVRAAIELSRTIEMQDDVIYRQSRAIKRLRDQIEQAGITPTGDYTDD